MENWETTGNFEMAWKVYGNESNQLWKIVMENSLMAIFTVQIIKQLHGNSINNNSINVLKL